MTISLINNSIFLHTKIRFKHLTYYALCLGMSSLWSRYQRLFANPLISIQLLNNEGSERSSRQSCFHVFIADITNDETAARFIGENGNAYDRVINIRVASDSFTNGDDILKMS